MKIKSEGDEYTIVTADGKFLAPDGTGTVDPKKAMSFASKEEASQYALNAGPSVYEWIGMEYLMPPSCRMLHEYDNAGRHRIVWLDASLKGEWANYDQPALLRTGTTMGVMALTDHSGESMFICALLDPGKAATRRIK